MTVNIEAHLAALRLARQSCMAAVEAIDLAMLGLLAPEPGSALPDEPPPPEDWIPDAVRRIQQPPVPDTFGGYPEGYEPPEDGGE